MKQLLLVRHAKAGYDSSDVNDLYRTLTQKGRNDAGIMKEVLENNYPRPDSIISSTATRAIETISLLLRGTPLLESVVTSADLYLASPQKMDSIICSLPDSISTVLLTGHNMGFTEYANRFEPIGELPTCAIVQIELSIDNWAEIYGAEGKIINYDYPRKHGI